MCVSIAVLLKASALREGGGTSPSRTHPLPVPPPPPPLLKFLDPPLLAPQTTSVAVCRNVLMASPARCNACYPKKLELVKNRKDELFNDLVDFLHANKLVGKEESSLNFVSVLCNCLWTIDGHQDTMTARFCPFHQRLNHFMDIIYQRSPNMQRGN